MSATLRTLSRFEVAAGAVLLALGGILRFAGLGWYDLSSDEAYHWLLSHHLLAAYYDEPGLVVWVLAASRGVAGDGEAGLRLLFAAAGLATVAALGLLCGLLGGRRAALVGLLLAAASPPLLLDSRRAMATVLADLLLLVTVILVAAARERPRLLAAAGLAAGLALNSRYTIWPALLGLGVYLLVERPPGWRSRWGLAALALVAAGLAPSAGYVVAHGTGGFQVRLLHAQGQLGGAGSLPLRTLHLAETLGWPLVPIVVTGLLPARGARAATWWPALLTVAAFAVSSGDSPSDVLPGLLPAAAGGVAVLLGWGLPARRTLLALAVAEGLLGVATLATSFGAAGLPSARFAQRDHAERTWDALGPALGRLAGGRTVESFDPDLPGLITYYSGVPATSSYPGYQDLPSPAGGDWFLVSSYPGADPRQPDADVIGGSGSACRTIHTWERQPGARLQVTYLGLLAAGRLGAPAAGCRATVSLDGWAGQLDARPGPGEGKTASLEKGAFDPLVAEGWGIGVPIAGYDDGQVVSAAGALVVRRGGAVEKVFALDRIDRSHRPLALFLPTTPRGTVTFGYGADGTIQVTPDLRPGGLRSLTALSETGGGTAVAAGHGSWSPVSDSGACLRRRSDAICVSGAPGHAGSEHQPPYLDWAGVDLELPPTRPASYHFRYLPDLLVPSSAPVIASPALTDGVVASAEWGPGGRLWLIDSSARPLPGWPVVSSAGFFSSPAMDGRGSSLRVVIGDDAGLVHAYDRSGRELPGWPLDLGYKVWSSPTLLPGGLMVVGDRDQVHLIGLDGLERPGWPRPIDGWPIATPAYDGRGVAVATLLIGSQRRGWLYAWDLDGGSRPGFPVRLTDDSDSSPTFLPGGGLAVADSAGAAFLIGPGGERRQLPGQAAQPIEASFTVAGGLAVVGSWDHVLRAWRLSDGTLAWTARAGDQLISSAAACSLDGGSSPDFVLSSKDGRLYAFDGAGRTVPGFPLSLGAPSFSSPLVADLDGDGYADVVVGAADGLHILRDVGPMGTCPWPMFRQGPQHWGAATG